MSLKNQIVRNAEYNAWANTRYVDWLSDKDDDVLVREAASSCPTILATLKHIWEAQEYWTGAVGETDDIIRVWELGNLTKEQIFSGLKANSVQLAEVAASFSEDELAMPLTIKNQWLDCSLPRAEYLQHAVSHAAYHRGQIVTIARGCGITDPPMTDFIVWATK